MSVKALRSVIQDRRSKSTFLFGLRRPVRVVYSFVPCNCALRKLLYWRTTASAGNLHGAGLHRRRLPETPRSSPHRGRWSLLWADGTEWKLRTGIPVSPESGGLSCGPEGLAQSETTAEPQLS